MHQPHHEPVPEERANILKVRPQGALFSGPPQLDWKGKLPWSTACRFMKLSRWPRYSRSISSSWGHTAVRDSNTCSWAAWQKKSCAWHHARCWSYVSLPLCRYRKGESVMAFTHVLI